MTPAPIPADDAARLSALRELLILDTPPEERFDRIVEFAAAEFDVPMALISLVDEQRQWFKARIGIADCETARETSFCGHAIMHSELFEVLDAALDPRFADNPFVIGDPYVRFYIGAPLSLPGGARIGTLCLIDTRPRELDAFDRALLGTLRDLVVAELTGRGEERAMSSGRLLLLEPQFVMRRTVATMAREMGLADVREATNAALAEKLMAEWPFRGLLIALDEDGEALALLRRLRAGATAQPADLPVAVTAMACDVELALRLKELNVCRLLLKPFKVRGMLEVISALGAPEPLPER